MALSQLMCLASRLFRPRSTAFAQSANTLMLSLCSIAMRIQWRWRVAGKSGAKEMPSSLVSRLKFAMVLQMGMGGKGANAFCISTPLRAVSTVRKRVVSY